MFLFVIVFLFIIVFAYFHKIHLFIDIPSFFKKGFIKIDNAHGLYCYCGKQGSGKTYSAIKFITDMKVKFHYTIITNIHSFNTFPDTIYLDNIFDIIDFILGLDDEHQKNYIILFDEIFTVLEKNPSRSINSQKNKSRAKSWDARQCHGSPWNI